MTIILMRAATSATEAINADIKLDGIKIPVQSVAQIATAAVLANGVSRLEEAVRYKVPFVLDPANRDDGTELMPWQHQLHDVAMIDRAKVILRRINGQTDDTDRNYEAELDFKAQRVASHVKDHIIQHGLHVYSQKWLFDSSRPLNDRLGLLQAMADPHFGPKSATTAIAIGLMSSLPVYSVPDFVRMLDATWKGVSFRVDNGDLHGWIASRRPYLVEFPLPNLAAGKTSRTDTISRAGGAETISLGLGFIMVDFDEQLHRFYVVTPMLSAKRTKQYQEPYSKQYILESYSRVYVKEYRQLADLLRNPGRTKVARLEVCPSCGVIFSKDHQDMAHTSCAS